MRWNHNIHYHPWALKNIPRGAMRALDVGCGEGMLARELRPRVPEVTGIDLHGDSIIQAREHGDDIEYVLGNVLTHPFASESFDLITTVATLHHMDSRAGIERMRELLRPGGTLAIVGCASNSSSLELPAELASVAAHRFYSRGREIWEHPSPTVWPPDDSYRDIRRLTRELLPGRRYRRRLLWRYTVLWTKPPSPSVLTP